MDGAWAFQKLEKIGQRDKSPHPLRTSGLNRKHEMVFEMGVYHSPRLNKTLSFHTSSFLMTLAFVVMGS